jgi:hypothetical protein
LDGVDTTPPVVSLTSFTGGGAYVGGIPQSITATVTDPDLAANPISTYYSTDGGSTWTLWLSDQANTGTYPITLPAIDSTTLRVKVTAIDAAGNVGSAESSTNFTVDTTPPVFTVAQMSLAGGAASTIGNYIPVAFTATDSAAPVSAYCLKYDSTSAPAAGDSCWVAVSPASSYAANVSFRLGFASGAYSVYVWAKNSAGLISALTNSGAGTLARDYETITFSPVPPPSLTGVTASANDGSIDLSVPMGNSVYIKWNASSAGTLEANPISIYYTTDDSTYTLVANNVLNVQNTGCTISGSETGCYQWSGGSPTSSYYRIRVGALDTNSRQSYQSTAPLNTTSTLRILAGVTDPGTGGSADAAVFMTQNMGSSYTYPGNLIVTNSGIVYFNDATRGLLKVDPTNGVQQLLIPRTGAVTDGAVPGTATLKYPFRITFDSQGRILVFDANVIRRYDPVAATITTIIGGGASTAATVAPLSLQITEVNNNGFNPMLFATPDGKIYFQASGYTGTTLAGGYNLRVYDPGTGMVTTLNFTGTGDHFSASQDITLCYGGQMGIGGTYDPVTGAIQRFIVDLSHSSAGCTDGVNGDHLTSIDPATNQPIGPFPAFGSGFYGQVVGANGVDYLFSRAANKIRKFDPATQDFIDVVGGSTNGVCADGTPAASCDIDVSDVYADGNGILYFLERGRIRTIDQSGNVQTFMGSGLTSGDGGPATSARMGTINDVKLWSNGGVDTVVFADNTQFRFREFPIGGNIATVAGNGSNVGGASTTVAANAQGISYGNCGGIMDLYLAVDPTNGTIYSGSRSADALSKIDRSTGKWVDLVGGGATDYSTAAADGLAGNQIDFSNCYNPMVVAYDGGSNLLVNKHRYYSNNDQDSFLKVYDTTTGTQTHLAGVPGVPAYEFSVDGTAGSTTNVPSSLESGEWDAYASRWIFASFNHPSEIRTQAVGGAIGTIATLANGQSSFAYRHDAANNVIYYCAAWGGNAGILQKYDVTTSTNTVLPWPIARMKCAGKGMIYSSSRGSLIFPFTQDGIGGVAEYLNP